MPQPNTVINVTPPPGIAAAFEFGLSRPSARDNELTAAINALRNDVADLRAALMQRASPIITGPEALREFTRMLQAR